MRNEKMSNENALIQGQAELTAQPSDDSTKSKPEKENAAPRQHGGGPSTAEGKLISCQNARKHSFFARQLFRSDQIGSLEHQEFTHLLAALTLQFKPCGVLERLYVEKIATETVRLGRLLAFENDVFRTEHPFYGNAVDKLLRYQSTINRQLSQASDQLERLQRMRAGDDVPTPLSVDVRLDVPFAGSEDFEPPNPFVASPPDHFLRTPPSRLLFSNEVAVAESTEAGADQETDTAESPNPEAHASIFEVNPSSSRMGSVEVPTPDMILRNELEMEE
jgi:hypothetical protein